MRPTARVRVAALVLGALGVLLLGYCARRPPVTARSAGRGPPASRTSNSEGTGRASAERVQRSAPPPHRIRCGPADCTGQQICCLGQVPACIPPGESCAAGDLPMECDDRADCPAGEVCCGEPGRYACAPRCLHVSWQLCSTDGECATGKCFHGSCAVATGSPRLRLPLTRSTASVVPSSPGTPGKAIARPAAIARPPATARPLPAVRLPRSRGGEADASGGS